MNIYRKTGLGHLRERIKWYLYITSIKKIIIKYNEIKQKDDKTKESEHAFVVKFANQQISESIEKQSTTRSVNTSNGSKMIHHLRPVKVNPIPSYPIPEPRLEVIFVHLAEA